MDVALATLAGFNVELEIGVTGCGFCNVLQRRAGKGSTPEIGVENHSSSIDDRAQRIGQ